MKIQTYTYTLHILINIHTPKIHIDKNEQNAKGIK
jgi:hypothetical protein